jgi:hypothetical protein
MATHPFTGAVKKKPTLKHRPAIWECMLGTVYARNELGETKYFHYDWDDARDWAGVTTGADLRLWRAAENGTGPLGSGYRKGQRVLYVLKEA